MNQSSQVEQITRSLAYMLRHKPEEFDLELDPFGAAEIGEVIQALNERLGEPIEEEDLLDAIHSGDRLRYDLKDGRIRALYGHSIQVDPGEACKPPELLYVGLGSRDAERAERYGLRAGRRSFLHLARAHEDALETGRYQARSYAVVTVYALDAWEQGINFYDRVSLFLSDPIPTEFLELGEIHTDGRPPMDRGGRERSSRGGRGRGRGRGERDSRDAGRDRDRDRPRDRDQDRERGDSEPRAEREPRRESRREEQPARESRDERRPRRERSEPRTEQPRRERSEARAEQPRRERSEARAEQPRRERGARDAEQTKVIPSQRQPRSSSAGGFGAGLADQEPDPARSRSSSEAAVPAAEPAPAPAAEPAPQPDPAPAPEKPAGPGFGAGV